MKNILLLNLAIVFLSISANAQNDNPERWEETITEFEKADKKDFPEKGAILFTGSSSIAMWNDVADYFPEENVINRGFGGSQFSDLLYYADRVIYPYQPSKVFIYEGDNDLAAGESVQSVLEEASKLREEIKQKLPQTEVIFISPKPSISRWNLNEKYEELNQALKEYANETPQTEFADVWSAMINRDGTLKKEVFLEDGLHMNAKGYKIWQSVLKPFLKEE